ncbi:DUF4956 domain-containing protein [Putridiphycobacter roseus]|uniref:DUF4956 domain-containing protein n=2 Tax=Putridiphycobacter roseus TaxID=2219161 RepID=A0A2W1NCV1_9FLAO|nr:DUF4956 domain-containing protein [Putridiphycobacter roseus]
MFLGMSLMSDDFYKLVFRFFVNLLFITLIIRFIYFVKTPRRNYLFTFYLISVITFMICFALKKLDIDTGMGLGLFAIFGIIRYRTNTMKIREMTYLFIAIGISVVNALAGRQVSYAELMFINITVLVIVYILETWLLSGTESSKSIVYEKIENIKPENAEILKADLENRTGLVINSFQIGNVDFLKDVAEIKIFYFQAEQADYHDSEA